MQCFQKDPNLRVSARKLLKHPWIVNARRFDSIVPKKSTEYEEAVRSVQEWNEALKSPDANDLRRTLRNENNSSTPSKQDVALPRNGQFKESASATIPKNVADKYRSPSDAGNDNWDDDFATAISPSALRLPHLRPQDNFGGMLSPEKLKAFASLDGTVMRHDDSFEDLDDPFQPSGSDPLQTIRPAPFKHASSDLRAESVPRSRQTKGAVPSLQNVPVLNPNPQPPTRQTRPTVFYKENSVEDYTDLIKANGDSLERKLGAFNVSIRWNG